MTTTQDSRLGRLIQLFENLQPGDVARLGECYSEAVYFRDPFNEVHSLAAMQAIFAHMFETLDAPRFVVSAAFSEGEQALLIWDFHFRMKGQAQPRHIHGSSHLRFALDGRCCYHRDYWDAAEELYEKLPVLGAVLRFIKRKLSATTAHR
ncbi:nuclear transport factor 2 family protein [Paucibacter sp. APW11]|uniref:Nuclear transport factor 2 family protein n=1 Tax=Roseateles aquae TaxID=3077235 RepID=A0ABU3PA73_9BURK|nr:nuclear transport factor 2 family protein [Paucibacter sp. APW11]MDT8999462.1 nuclear transport factor 2 family protein [Paucibacter sp. APW11]